MPIKFDDEKENKSLKDLKKNEEENLIQTIAMPRYGVTPINLHNIPIDNDALRSISEKEAIKQEVAPFKILGRDLHVAVKSPREEKIKELTKYFSEKGYTPRFYMASTSSLEKVWERYKEISYASKSKAGSIAISGRKPQENDG